MSMDDQPIDYWPGLRCRFELRLRTWAGVVTIGQLDDPFVALRHGKEIARQRMMSGKGWSILAVEVVDIRGDLVLGETAEALSDFLNEGPVAGSSDTGLPPTCAVAR